MAEPTRPGWRFVLPLLAVIAICPPAVAQPGGVQPSGAQPSGCVLTKDDQNPSEQILRCGDSLTIHTAPGTRYRLENQAQGAPAAARLDTGALMIEFHGNAGQQNFQILTPQAIASVRGTKWIVDAAAGQTSTFVIAGTVSVSRRHDGRSADLGPGEGLDVGSGSGPVVVKRWPATRVKALLARFGQ
jgi:ferric-dicitrate binding protein FerR (iron transport regulator)